MAPDELIRLYLSQNEAVLRDNKLRTERIIIMKAFLNGQTVEASRFSLPIGSWLTVAKNHDWCFASYEYRIKPEPQYQPWTLEEATGKRFTLAPHVGRTRITDALICIIVGPFGMQFSYMYQASSCDKEVKLHVISREDLLQYAKTFPEGKVCGTLVSE